jgi:hypothetical protein
MSVALLLRLILIIVFIIASVDSLQHDNKAQFILNVHLLIIMLYVYMTSSTFV